MSKANVISRLCAAKLIALLRADDEPAVTQTAKALIAGGIHAWEVPMISPAVPDFIGQVVPHFPDFIFGLGTVIDTETARRGILAGAKFISTPALRPEVILLCRRHQIPVICGVHSQAELGTALLAGADAIKLYPSEDHFGPALVHEMKTEFPDSLLFPVGGITAANAIDFAQAGAAAMFVSSFLHAPDDEAPVSFTNLTAKATAVTASLNPVLNDLLN